MEIRWHRGENVHEFFKLKEAVENLDILNMWWVVSAHFHQRSGRTCPYPKLVGWLSFVVKFIVGKMEDQGSALTPFVTDLKIASTPSSFPSFFLPSLPCSVPEGKWPYRWGFRDSRKKPGKGRGKGGSGAMGSDDRKRTWIRDTGAPENSNWPSADQCSV